MAATNATLKKKKNTSEASVGFVLHDYVLLVWKQEGYFHLCGLLIDWFVGLLVCQQNYT